jgi:hypothetical protein
MHGLLPCRTFRRVIPTASVRVMTALSRLTEFDSKPDAREEVPPTADWVAEDVEAERARDVTPSLSPAVVMRLQRSAGNAAVSTLIAERSRTRSQRATVLARSSPGTLACNGGRVLQRAALKDYHDGDPLHDPSRLTDPQIEATDEYKAYMAMPVVIPLRPVRPEEARLACRLLLRNMRQTPTPVTVSNDVLMQWLDRARSRTDSTQMAESMVGKEQWVRATAGDVQAPTTAASEFTKWMLGAGHEPNPATGKLNCWEMVLFSAYRAGHLTEDAMRKMYTGAKTAMTASGDTMQFPRTLEQSMRSSAEQIYDPTKPDSPRPLRGDLVIFKEAASHVALATGNLMGGQVEIVSHWGPPDHSLQVKITTIEALLPFAGVTVAKFWSPKW